MNKAQPVAKIRRAILRMFHDLDRPLTEADRLAGWTDDLWSQTRAIVEAFQAKIASSGELPPAAEWPVRSVVTLDHCGVSGGKRLERLARFEIELRRIRSRSTE